MDQLPGYLETCPDGAGTLLVVGAPHPKQETNNSSSSHIDAINRPKAFRPKIKGRTLKLYRWHFFLFFIGVVSSKQVGPNAPINGISEKYAERFAAISNNAIDPCQHFDLFSCTKNVTRTVDENGRINTTYQMLSTTYTETAESVLHVVRSLLEEPSTKREIRAVRMAKQLYNKCIHNTSLSSYNNNLSLTNTFTYDEDFLLESQLANIFAHNEQSIFSLVVDEDEDTLINLLTFDIGDPIPQIYSEYSEFEKELKILWEASDCEEDEPDLWQGKSKRVFTLNHIQRKIPQIKWTKLVEHLFDILGLKERFSSKMKVQFRCLNFFRGLGNLIGRTGLDTVFTYIDNRYTVETLSYLDLDDELDNSDSVELQKNEDELDHPSWKYCASIVKKGFGVALAHLYQKKNPKTRTKKKIVQEISHYLKMAFRQVISNQAWIPAKGKDRLKKKLFEKLKQMKIKISYAEYKRIPTVVDEYYGDLVLNDSSFILNVLGMKKFLALKVFTRVHTKVHKNTDMTLPDQPLEVTAEYHPSTNEISIPIGLLHYPMFDEDYPMYLNFANLGFFMAHELVHAFDNNWINYDKNGDLTSVLNDDAQKAFTNQTACFVEQYGKFKLPLIDKFVNGNDTLGENICDNAGFPLILIAYEMWAKDRNVKEPVLPGLNFTIPQIFHIAFGQLFCEVPSEETSLDYTEGGNVHSPRPWRVKGVMQNNANFGNTFGCPAGTPMNPTHKCSLWS